MVLHEVKSEHEDLREELLVVQAPALMSADCDESFIAATDSVFPGSSFGFDYSDEDDGDAEDDFDDMEEDDFDDDDDDEDDDDDFDDDEDDDDYDYDEDFEDYDED